MITKAYINNDQTATFVCPQCQKPRVKDVSKYIARKELTRLKVTCSCGHQYLVYLEKRKKFRKQTNLDGKYKFTAQDHENQKTEVTGRMTVTDLSSTGLRAKLPATPRFSIGEKLNIEFQLDDINHSLIRKEVIVQNVFDFSVGLEFVFNQSFDPVLGFYLLSKP
jgi:c-di-GMP-binding flagellar brake protein YcgR